MRLELAERVTFALGDLFAPFERTGERFHVIAANLPYVPSGALAGLEPDVRDYEPRLALDGGPAGLDVVARAVARGNWEAADVAIHVLDLHEPASLTSTGESFITVSGAAIIVNSDAANAAEGNGDRGFSVQQLDKQQRGASCAGAVSQSVVIVRP